MVFLNNKTIEEKIRLAKSCDDEKTQKKLARSYDIKVRTALAKNSQLTTSVANSLLFDPSINVSFHASMNSSCTQKRVFLQEDLSHKCVGCEIDELVADCNNCNI